MEDTDSYLGIILAMFAQMRRVKLNWCNEKNPNGGTITSIGAFISDITVLKSQLKCFQIEECNETYA